MRGGERERQAEGDVRHAERELRHQQGEKPLSLAEAAHGGMIDYIDFPPALVGKYQSYTQADLTALRAVGCKHSFADVQTGVSAYMNKLAQLA